MQEMILVTIAACFAVLWILSMAGNSRFARDIDQKLGDMLLENSEAQTTITELSESVEAQGERINTLDGEIKGNFATTMKVMNGVANDVDTLIRTKIDLQRAIADLDKTKSDKRPSRAKTPRKPSGRPATQST